jgi:hypothetical protein
MGYCLSLGSPLATPWWAEANISVGFVFVICVSLILFAPGAVAHVRTGFLAPILYYTNTWYSEYLPYVNRFPPDLFSAQGSRRQYVDTCIL